MVAISDILLVRIKELKAMSASSPKVEASIRVGNSFTISDKSHCQLLERLVMQ